MKACLVVVLAALAALSGSASAAENPDAALITPYPGSVINTNEVYDFDELVIPLGPRKNGEITKSQKVQGRWTRLEYSFPEGRSALEVYKNYEQGLTKAGFKVVFTCKEAACGGDSVSVKGLGNWPYETSHYLAARLDRSGERIWALVDVRTGLSVYVNVLREKAMETGMVRVDAAALKKGIADEGHVAVYGIEFDTGKAELKPASAPIIDEIARLLTADPKLKIYVVGHTDNVGGLDSNLGLSRKRADSVVHDLVTRHKIAAARVVGQGVGPLVPVTTNGTVDGRARNRRVDLVRQ